MMLISTIQTQGLQPVDMEMVYVDKHGMANVVCPMCEKSQHVDVTEISSSYVPREAACDCGTTFVVLFEKRRHHRKEVNLPGLFWDKSDQNESGYMVVKNLSRSGIGFQVLSKDFKEADGIDWIKPGVILHVEFRMKDKGRSLIHGDVLVRNTTGGYVGAEFDAQTAKAVGDCQ